MKNVRLYASGILAAALALAVPAVAQGPKVAVIDSDRIVAESIAGQEALAKLKRVQEAKMSEGVAYQEEIQGLRGRLEQGRLSLSEERLRELSDELERKAVAFKRFQEDADRELSEARDKALSGIERQVLEVIDEVGVEDGYTLIFNKFRSGLVFAQPTVDITDVIIERFNAKSSSGG